MSADADTRACFSGGGYNGIQVGQRLSDVEDSSDEALQYRDEVATYIDYKTSEDDSFDVLSWLGEHVIHFPILLRLIIAIPESSAANEDERRSQLKPSTAVFAQQSKAPRQTPDSVIPRHSIQCVKFCADPARECNSCYCRKMGQMQF